MKYIVNDNVVLSRPLEGPLSAHIAAFAQWARDRGYAWSSRAVRGAQRVAGIAQGVHILRHYSASRISARTLLVLAPPCSPPAGRVAAGNPPGPAPIAAPTISRNGPRVSALDTDCRREAGS